jgi:hypothetical protein
MPNIIIYVLLIIQQNITKHTKHYKIYYNGNTHICSSFRYNDVGCIMFMDESIYPPREVSYCNNVIIFRIN